MTITEKKTAPRNKWWRMAPSSLLVDKIGQRQCSSSDQFSAASLQLKVKPRKRRQLLREPAEELPSSSNETEVASSFESDRQQDRTLPEWCQQENNPTEQRELLFRNETISGENIVIGDNKGSALKASKVAARVSGRAELELAADEMDRKSSRKKWAKRMEGTKFGAMGHKQRQLEQADRTRRKSDLTTFLTILFGLLSVFLLVQSSCQTTLATKSTSAPAGKILNDINSTQLSGVTKEETTTTSLATIGLLAKSNASSSDDGGQLGGAISIGKEINETDENEEDDEEGTGSDKLESPNESGANNRTKLATVINETIESSSSSFPDRLTKSKASSDESEEENEGASDDEKGELGEVSGAKLSKSNSTMSESQAQVGGETKEQDEQLRYAMETYARWKVASDDFSELLWRKFFPLIVEHGYEVDSGTAAGVLTVWNAVRAWRPWALRLLDSWTKLSPGILTGTQSDFGDFDECINVRAEDPSGLEANNPELPVEIDPATNLKSTTVVGRYCLADIEFPKPPRKPLAMQTNHSTANWHISKLVTDLLRSKELAIDNKWAPIELRKPLLNFSHTADYKDTIFVETGNFLNMLYIDPVRVGICLTNKVDPESFAKIVNKLLEEFRVSINFRNRCVTKYDRVEWTQFQVVSAYILIAACSLLVVSTILDLLEKRLHKISFLPQTLELLLHGKLRKSLSANRDLLTSFSLIRNTKRLFKAQQQKQMNNQLQQQQQQQLLLQEQEAAKRGINMCQYNMSLYRSAGPARQSTTSLPAAGSRSSGSTVGDSSVECSPSIERRTKSSSVDGGSSVELISASSNKQQLLNSYSQSTSCSTTTTTTTANTTTTTPTTVGNHLDQQGYVNLRCLHGIRVITMTWMIVNHTYMFGGFFVLWAYRRLIDIAEWPKSMSFQLVLNGWLTVETYFFLSALIIVLNVMPLLRTKRFNYFAYVIHRLLRLTPAYIGLVCLNFLWPLVSSGPVWLVKGKSFVQYPCENYLWTNFLFINNWIWPEKQCMVHTWFLSADFQLYLLAPIVVYLLYRRPVYGHSLNLIIAVLASILSGLVIYANELLPTTLINKLEFGAIKQQLSYSYFATYQHMGPYCLGILTGYVLNKRPHIKLPKHLTWLLWLLLPPLSFTTLMLTYLWNGAYEDDSMINPSPLVSALYIAIHRTIWTSLVAWLVFACSTGRAKMLSNFLSHSMFIPISRLSYSIYLVHLPVIMFRSLNLRHSLEWTDQNILWEACGNFVASLVMGYFLNVAFESPFINIESALTKRGRSISQEKSHHNRPPRLGLSTFHCDLLPSQNKSAGGLKQQEQLDGDKSKPKEQDNYSSAADSTSGCDTANSSPERERRQNQAPNSADQSVENSPPSLLNLDLQWEREANDQQAVATSAQQDQRVNPSVNQNGKLAQIESDKLARNNQTTRQMANSLQQQQEQRKRLQMQMRLLSNTDDIYNVNAEYRHYAPGNYRDWRLANGMMALNSGPSESCSSRTNRPVRPRQYATLARTDHLSNGVTTAGGLNQSPGFFGAHYSTPAADPLWQAPPMNWTARNEHQHMRMDPPIRWRQSMRASDHYRETSEPAAEERWTSFGSSISRRQGRYSTLTGVNGREWRSHNSEPGLLAKRPNEVPKVIEYQNENPYQSNWPKQFDSASLVHHLQTMDKNNASLSMAATSLSLDGGSTSMSGDDGAPVSAASQWLNSGLMIPRIDSSTLRRQARRGELNASNSIVEEPLDEEEKSAL